jgi:hypothetical protein
VFISLFFIFYFITSSNIIFNTRLWERFKIEDGMFKGDNRVSKDLDKIYTGFMKSDDLLLGRGKLFAKNWGEGSASYKMTILSNGLIFFIILISSFWIFALLNINQRKYFYGYLFIFFGMMYQRPGFINNPTFFFIFIVSVYAVNILKEDSGLLKNNSNI